MARLKTPPVTVVQGDDAPDIVITLQQDSSGTPYVLTDKAAFVVIVDTQEPDRYVAKYEATIEDESAGKVRISWIKDPATMTSYLDDLTPGKRYELQVFLGRTNLPPSSVTLDSYYDYFRGKYRFTGAWQEGCPIFKHETEDLFLSRSPYTGGGADDFAWLVTSLRAATWSEVKGQNKYNLSPGDLTLIPVWNYRQIISASDAAEFSLTPRLSNTDADAEYVSVFTAKDGSGGPDPLTIGEYLRDPTVTDFYSAQHVDNASRPDVTEHRQLYFRTVGAGEWRIVDPYFQFYYARNKDVSDPTTPPATGWELVFGPGEPESEISVQSYAFNSSDRHPFIGDNRLILPTGAVSMVELCAFTGAGDANSNGLYSRHTSGFEWQHLDNPNRDAFYKYLLRAATYADLGYGEEWAVIDFDDTGPGYANPGDVAVYPPEEGWTWDSRYSPFGAPPPTKTQGSQQQAVDMTETQGDLENRGTQTVLTQIPLIVKPAYRLGNAD